VQRQLREAAPDARVRIIDVPPVAGAALLGLDHVQAPPAAESRRGGARGDARARAYAVASGAGLEPALRNLAPVLAGWPG